eukprot:1161832-Pelagomonas_calceolata.AAC.1
MPQVTACCHGKSKQNCAVKDSCSRKIQSKTALEHEVPMQQEMRAVCLYQAYKSLPPGFECNLIVCNIHSCVAILRHTGPAQDAGFVAAGGHINAWVACTIKNGECVIPHSWFHAGLTPHWCMTPGALSS